MALLGAVSSLARALSKVSRSISSAASRSSSSSTSRTSSSSSSSSRSSSWGGGSSSSRRSSSSVSPPPGVTFANALSELGRAQRAMDEYRAAGRQDLVQRAQNHFNQISNWLASQGLRIDPKGDYRSLWSGSGPAGAYTPSLNISGSSSRTSGGGGGSSTTPRTSLPMLNALLNSLNSTSGTRSSTQSKTPRVSPSPPPGVNFSNALAELGRAQRAMDEYLQAGRYDLAQRAQQHFNQIANWLRSQGMNINPNDDFRSLWQGIGPAGAYDPTQPGMVQRSQEDINAAVAALYDMLNSYYGYEYAPYSYEYAPQAQELSELREYLQQQNEQLNQLYQLIAELLAQQQQQQNNNQMMALWQAILRNPMLWYNPFIRGMYMSEAGLLPMMRDF